MLVTRAFLPHANCFFALLLRRADASPAIPQLFLLGGSGILSYPFLLNCRGWVLLSISEGRPPKKPFSGKPLINITPFQQKAIHIPFAAKTAEKPGLGATLFFAAYQRIHVHETAVLLQNFARLQGFLEFGDKKASKDCSFKAFSNRINLPYRARLRQNDPLFYALGCVSFARARPVLSFCVLFRSPSVKMQCYVQSCNCKKPRSKFHFNPLSGISSFAPGAALLDRKAPY